MILSSLSIIDIDRPFRLFPAVPLLEHWHVQDGSPQRPKVDTTTAELLPESLSEHKPDQLTIWTRARSVLRRNLRVRTVTGPFSAMFASVIESRIESIPPNQ